MLRPLSTFPTLGTGRGGWKPPVVLGVERDDKGPGRRTLAGGPGVRVSPGSAPGDWGDRGAWAADVRRGPR